MINLDTDIQAIQADIENLNNPAFADLAVLTVPNILKGLPWNILHEQLVRSPDAVSVLKGLLADPLVKKFSKVNRIGAPGYSGHFKGVLINVSNMVSFLSGYREAGGSPEIADLIKEYYDLSADWRAYQEERFNELVNSGYEGLISLFSLDGSETKFLGNSMIPVFPMGIPEGSRFIVTAPEKFTTKESETVQNSRLDETFGSLIMRLRLRK